MQRHFSDTLTAAVQDWCRRSGVDLQGKTVLCAVSGGRDSMVLLHLMLRLGAERGFAVAAAHYNHRLRESAARDEALVREWCGRHGVPLTVDSGDVRAYAGSGGRSVEDAARQLRYAFLERAARECGADFIATAHHRQDNAETLLLHLLRGSGLNGLGGITPVRGRIIRPLLDADRADIDGYIAENSLPYAEDETNQDTAYTRNRLRLELLPLLEEIAPGSVGRIADAAQRLRGDEELLRQYCAALTPDGGAELPASLLKEQHPAAAARLVRGAAQRFGAELTAAQTDAVLHLRGGACLALGGGLRAVREGKNLRFFRVPDQPAPAVLSPGEQIWGEYTVTLSETAEAVTEDETTVVLGGSAERIEIAAWDGTGRLAVENGRRTVKRLLADRGIPAAQRENRPAVYTDGVLAAVFGAGTDHALRPLPGEKKLVVSIQKKNL